jgi:hypothetical protein
MWAKPFSSNRKASSPIIIMQLTNI